MIEQISHMTFVVVNLEKATQFFTTVFDAQEIYSSGEQTHSISQEKFFLIGNIWIAIMIGDALKEQTYNHIAFKINESDYDMYLDRIKSLAVTIRESRSRIEGEGRSIYFYDFDNHLFELHTGTLNQRLAHYQK